MRFAAVLAAAGLLMIATSALLGGHGASAQSTTTIEVGDLYFCDPSFQNGVCATTVNEGDTVEWQFVGFQPHSTTACADDHATCSEPRLWDSGSPQTSGSFSYTFDAPGTYLYRCQVHPDEMRGQVTVVAAAASSPSPAASPQATAPATTPTVSLAPTVVPSGGGAPGGEGDAAGLLAVIGGGLLVASGVVVAVVLRRRGA